MKLYRAMCPEEAVATCHQRHSVFIKRFKWFSPSKSFCISRVQDGVFGNSMFVQNRYCRLLEFELDETSAQYFVKLNENEWKLDRRQAHNVHWTHVKEHTQ